MLVNFTISNFKVFGKEVLFSTEILNKKNKDKDYVSHSGFNLYPYLMKTVGIFGPNASGKTSLFEALAFLKELITKSHSFGKDKKLIYPKFKLDPKLLKKPTEIAVEFIKEEVLYSYFVSIGENEILQETLSKRAKGKGKKEIILLDRKEKNIHKSISNANEIVKESWFQEINPNQSLVSYLNNKKSINGLKLFCSWWQGIQIFEGMKSRKTFLFTSFDEFKDQIEEFLQVADLGLTGIFLGEKRKINIKEHFWHDLFEKCKLNSKKFPDQILVDLINSVIYEFTEEDVYASKIFFRSEIHESEVFFEIEELSQGTKTLICYAGVILETFEFGKVLLIDELERSLHPFLLRFILSVFQNKEINKSDAQLIFTSHGVTLMDKEILQPEQIYFTEKDEKTLQSKLFSLGDFKIKTDRDTKFYQKYLAGKYGAYPQMKDFDEIKRK